MYNKLFTIFHSTVIESCFLAIIRLECVSIIPHYTLYHKKMIYKNMTKSNMVNIRKTKVSRCIYEPRRFFLDNLISPKFPNLIANSDVIKHLSNGCGRNIGTCK